MGKMVFPLFLVVYIRWRTIQNILMPILGGSQVSDRCPLGYLFFMQSKTLFPETALIHVRQSETIYHQKHCPDGF